MTGDVETVVTAITTRIMKKLAGEIAKADKSQTCPKLRAEVHQRVRDRIKQSMDLVLQPEKDDG